MAYLSDFLPYVLPYLPGCSVPLAEMTIRQICIDFCNHSQVVQVQLDPMDVIKGQTVYDIETPNASETVFIRQAFFRGGLMPLINGIDAICFPSTTPPGIPTALQQKANNAFELDRPPDSDFPQSVLLLVSTRPTRGANLVADVLLNDYAYGIGQGVIGRLALMPGQAFSNPSMAAVVNEAYIRCRTDARIRAEKGFNNAPSRVQARLFQ